MRIMSAELDFTNAVVIASDYVYLSASLSDMSAYSPHTRLCLYDEQSDHMWSKHDVDWWTTSVAIFLERADSDWILCAMSEEGDVEFMSADAPINEKIPGAGVFSEGAKGWGYMRTLRQIGEHLYAVGSAGQVYRRLGRDHWEHMDEGVLQSPPVENRLLLADIHGTDETDMYLCGAIPGAFGYEGRLFHRDGQSWTPLTTPTTEPLNAIYIDNPECIWIAGDNGTLLRGNHKDGFKDMSSVDDNQRFGSIVRFQDKLYLASNMGLFMYDGTSIQEVRTGLVPDIQDANVVDAMDGVLWSVGTKDIVRFDGEKWERIHHPDNPRIDG